MLGHIICNSSCVGMWPSGCISGFVGEGKVFSLIGVTSVRRYTPMILIPWWLDMIGMVVFGENSDFVH